MGNKLDNPVESTVSPVMLEPSSLESTKQGTDTNPAVDNTSTAQADVTALQPGESLLKRKPIFKKELNTSSNVNHDTKVEHIRPTCTGESVVKEEIEPKAQIEKDKTTVNGQKILTDIKSDNAKNKTVETDSQSDEDFLLTRRKSGRKRLSNGKNKQCTKRQKGVLYEDKAESDQENMVSSLNLRYHPLQNNRIVDQSKFKAFADGKINVTQ